MTVDEHVWRRAILPRTATIQDAVRSIEDAAIKIALIVNEDGTLEGTVTDGDIRRGLLQGLNLTSDLNSVIHREALVVPQGVDRSTILSIMLANKIQQIPIINENHVVVGLHLWDRISSIPARDNLMIIMAGGKGTRLRPYTENCPKPMVQISGKPMLQHIIERGKQEGFNRFVLAIHHMGHMIEEYFGDGDKWSVRIDYLREEAPLGTAGALGLLNPSPHMPVVVTNADVFTQIRYGDLLDFHIKQGADATMAVREYEWQHPFGVVRINGTEIVGFEEKPVIGPDMEMPLSYGQKYFIHIIFL